MARPKLYVETSVISYLTGRPSRDLIIAGRQAVTHEWWANRRRAFELFCSQFVISEVRQGDPDAAHLRLEALRDLKVLAATPEALDLATRFIEKRFLPRDSLDDAAHIAVATVHGMDFLLSWNCAHIANAEVHRAVSLNCSALGLQSPTVCTPDELLGD